MVPEKDLELINWLCMIILKINPISIVQDIIYRSFTGFKHKIGTTHQKSKFQNGSYN